MKRIDLGSGDWVDLSERPTHDQYNAIYKAFVAANGDNALAMDLMATAVTTLTTASSIRGEDGQLLDPRTAIGSIPENIVMQIAAEAIVIWESVKLPKASTPKSSSDSPAESSPIETLPTP